MFDSIGSFRNYAISKARIIVKEVYGLGFGDTLNKVLELLEKFNFTALDQTKVSSLCYILNVLIKETA